MGGIVSSIGDAVGSIFGGGSSSAPSQPNTQVYQAIGTNAQDQNLNTLLNQNLNGLTGTNNPYSQLTPQMQQAFQSLFNTPGASSYQQAAGTAGNNYSVTGNNDMNLMNMLNNASGLALNSAGNVLNTATDPQNALYNQTLQKVNDSVNVANAQQGLTGQAAAGNVATADSNFNIDWQNNELQRALQGLTGYNQTVANVAGADTTANNIGTAGAANTLLSGSTPYTTNQAIGGNEETAISQYLSQLLGPSTSNQSLIQNLQNYLNTGTAQSNYGASAALQDYYGNLQNSAQSGAALGGILGFNTGGGSTIGSSLYNSLPSLSGLSGLFSGASGAAGASSAGFDALDLLDFA